MNQLKEVLWFGLCLLGRVEGAGRHIRGTVPALS